MAHWLFRSAISCSMLLAALLLNGRLPVRAASSPQLLLRAVHNTDTVRTIGYSTSETDLFSKKGTAVSTLIATADLGFEDEVGNRETHHLVVSVNIVTSGKATSKKTLTADVVFVGGRVYYRNSADRKWRNRRATTFVEPLTGAVFERKRTTVKYLLRSTFTQESGAPAGKALFRGTTASGLLIDRSFKKMDTEVLTSTNSHPYVLRIANKGSRVVSGITVQSTVITNFDSFNQAKTIRAPH